MRQQFDEKRTFLSSLEGPLVTPSRQMQVCNKYVASCEAEQ
jgi:hypothetical protein